MNEYEQNIEIMKDLRNRLDKVINKDSETPQEYPDAAKHKNISFVKSGFRIVAGLTLALGGYYPELAFSFLKAAGGLLILAEILGVAEEMV